MAKFLTRENYSVTTTTDPKEGVDLSKRNKFDLILLDSTFQSKRSIDVLNKILINNEDYKVIITTPRFRISDSITYLRLGAYDYIEKTDDVEKLKTIIESIMQ